MTKHEFAPKDAETLKSEILEETGIDYEDNQEMVDKLVDRELKSEDFKASLHEQKEKRGEKAGNYQEMLKKAGLDPETGEKLVAKATGDGETTPKNDNLSPKDFIAMRDLHEEDIDYLLDESKLRKKSISELKKDPYMQIILKTREEERATAEATNTKVTRSGNKGESLLSKVDKNEDMTQDQMTRAAKEVVEGMKKR